MLERISLMVGRVYMLDRDALKREDGQTVVEYGLVLAFVAVALASVLIVLKGGIGTFIKAINDTIAALPGF